MVRSRNKQSQVMNCGKATPMTSNDEKQLLYLEKMVNNQKQMIDLISMLNNNVEELMTDIRDLKNSHKIVPTFKTTSTGSLHTTSSQHQLPTVPVQLSQLPNLNAVSNGGGPTLTTVLLHNNHNSQPRTAIPLTTFKSFNTNNNYQLFQTTTTSLGGNGGQGLAPSSANLAATTTLNAISTSIPSNHHQHQQQQQQNSLTSNVKPVLAPCSNTSKAKSKSSRKQRNANTIGNEMGNLTPKYRQYSNNSLKLKNMNINNHLHHSQQHLTMLNGSNNNNNSNGINENIENNDHITVHGSQVVVTQPPSLNLNSASGVSSTLPNTSNHLDSSARNNTADASNTILNDTNLNSHRASNGIVSTNSSDDIMQYADHHPHHHHHHHHHHHQDDGQDNGLKSDDQNNIDVHLDLNNNESDNLSSLSGERIKYNQAHAFINSNPNESANSIMNNSSSDSNIDNPNGMCDLVDTKLESFPIMIKSVKSGLREFSTFVSKKVRLEFGFDSLASKRINELDRDIMNKIKDEAIEKYLPSNVAPQLAWNHAMNSLRQLRHRQCKKLKPF